MAQTKVTGDVGLAEFQNLNCQGCKFADNPKVGTGEPCCTHWQMITVDGGKCLTRRES